MAASTTGSTGGGTTGTTQGSTGSALWVTGYYVGWESNAYPVAAVDYAAMTHIVIGPVIPQQNGTLDTTFSIDAINGPAWAVSASQAAHKAGDKVLLWVGGAGSESGFLGASSANNLATLVANLTAAMETYGADGLDLDWEPLNTADEPSFTGLIQALRIAKPDAIFTMAVGTLDMNYQTVDPFYAQVAPLVDQMNLMSYGMAGAYSGWDSWHSSPISGEAGHTPESIDTSIPAYEQQGVPSSKLGLGIGFYGLCYSMPVTGPRQVLNGSTIVASDGDISFANIMGLYYSADAHQWDSTSQVPFLSFQQATGPKGCSYISYDDSQSVVAKADYVKAQKLGGVIIWEIAEGYIPSAPAGQENGLIEAIKSSFLQ